MSRPSRRGWAIGGGSVAVAAALAITVVTLSASSADDATGAEATTEADAPSSTRATATATTQDLIRTETLTGELSFGPARSVATQVDGVVTYVADEGGQVAFNSALFAVNTQPVILLAGSVPAYRELSEDSAAGADITQLEQALVDLGFGDGITVDTEFDDATADQVEAWEESLNREDPDGTVALGDVVFAAQPVQVASVVAPVGAQVTAGSTVLDATSTTKQIDVDLAVSRADDVVVGTPVTVDLPDGTTTTATITDIGTVPESNAADPSAEDTVAVVVLPDSADATACCTSGSVDVIIERSRDVGAVVVPVSALLALAEGGYAVEVVAADGGTSLVRVEPGSFADDLVAVTGIDDGTEVVVAG